MLCVAGIEVVQLMVYRKAPYNANPAVCKNHRFHGIGAKAVSQGHASSYIEKHWHGAEKHGHWARG